MDLDSIEVRVLGCLIEKQRTTPDAYPLSLNALRLACNQSTNRDPVVAYDEEIIRGALHRLGRRRFTRLTTGHTSRAAKYRHLLDEELHLDRAEQAVLAVLMLRGDQTPGELKQRTERMQPFDSIDELDEVLTRLIDREFVAQLARRPGQKEERFHHRLSEDADDVETPDAVAAHGRGRGPATAAARRPAGQARTRGGRAARGARRAALRTRRVSTFEVPPERLAAWLTRWAQEHDAIRTETRPGRVTFTGADGATARRRAAVPAARLARRRSRRFAPQPLLDHAARDRVVGVLLVRLGGYAAGVFNGKRLVDSKVGQRPVHGRNSAGGQSQKRYERRRDGQSRVAHDAAADAGAGVLLHHFEDLDAVVLGGDRFALAAVLEDPRLRKLSRLTTERVLDVPDPRLAVLRATPDQFRATMLHTLDPRPAPPDAAPL